MADKSREKEFRKYYRIDSTRSFYPAGCREPAGIQEAMVVV